MIRINPAIKNLVVIALILVGVVMVILAVPAEVTSGQSTLLWMLFFVILAAAFFYFVPWKRLTVKPTSYMEDMKVCIERALADGVTLPVALKDGKMYTELNYDINMKLGKYHFVRFLDPYTDTTRNLLYDVLNKVPVGELKHTKINAIDKVEALNAVMQVIQMIESGKPVEKYVAPTLVKEIERAPQEQSKEKKI